MGIFYLFSKNAELPAKERKWNKMWDLWAEGKAASPYAQLMTYESEVNNGGHCQYFDNAGNICGLKTEVGIAEAALPEPLKSNVQRAYEAYLAQRADWDEQYDMIFNECDDMFYAHEQLRIALLEDYAETMKL